MMCQVCVKKNRAINSCILIIMIFNTRFKSSCKRSHLKLQCHYLPCQLWSFVAAIKLQAMPTMQLLPWCGTSHSSSDRKTSCSWCRHCQNCSWQPCQLSLPHFKWESIRLRQLHSKLRAAQLQKDCLLAKLEAVVEQDGITLDGEVHDNICTLIVGGEPTVIELYPKDSFQQLFWQQQQQAARVKNSCFMRWHPLFIRWCSYLKHVSCHAYDILRQTGCIKLPSQRTLRDYTHYIPATSGFLDEVDIQLKQTTNIDTCAEHAKYIAIVLWARSSKPICRDGPISRWRFQSMY